MKALEYPSLEARNTTVNTSGRLGLPFVLSTSRTASILFCLGLLPIVCGPSLPAQTDETVDGATLKDGQAFSMRGGELEALKKVLKLPFEVEVFTNGTFNVAGGKERKLQEGQIIRRDGWLLNTDGSIQPVFDHVTQQAGQVLVVRDGEPAIIGEVTTFPNNLTIAPDGWCNYPSGTHARLSDGQFFRLDGSSVLSKDTVTLMDGVVVQKDGKLISLDKSNKIMGMNDGTKVYATGVIQLPDGTMFPLQEGQTVFIEGRASRH
jgi:hypothetical protein